MRLFVHMSDLRLHTWFGVIKNLSVDMLFWASFIDQCTQGIFPFERSIVLGLSRPVEIVSTQKKVNAIADDTTEVDVHMKANRDTPTEENYLCRIAGQVEIPAFPRRLRWLVAVVQVSRRLRPIEISLNTNVPRLCKASWTIYTKAILRLSRKHDRKSAKYAENPDLHNTV